MRSRLSISRNGTMLGPIAFAQLREIVVAGRRAWDVSEVTISPLAGHGRVLAAGRLGLGEVTILGRGPDHCSAERIRVRLICDPKVAREHRRARVERSVEVDLAL